LADTTARFLVSWDVLVFYSKHFSRYPVILTYKGADILILRAKNTTRKCQW